MSSIEWSNNLYGLGIPSLDEEHQALLEMINNLSKSIQSGGSDSELGATITTLVEFAMSHFANEEKIMLELGFKGYERHKAQHQAMTKKIANILMRLKNDEDVSARELLSFLKTWWTEHIVKEDKKFGKPLEERIGSKQPATT